MKYLYLRVAIPAVVALVACRKKTTYNPSPQQEGLITLSVSSPQKAVSSGAVGPLGTSAEFTVTGSPVKANGNASISVENAQLPAVSAATGSVAGVVKLTFDNLAAADKVSAKLTKIATGSGASVQIVSAVLPTTGVLQDGKLKTPLTATATPITRGTGNSNELFLLFQSGVNGFSDADTAVVEITAKDTKFTVTVVGKGTKKKAENQTAVNKVEMRPATNQNMIYIKSDQTGIQLAQGEFTVFNKVACTKTKQTTEDLNIVINKDKAGEFKTEHTAKAGMAHIVFTNAIKLTHPQDSVTFTTNIKSVTPRDDTTREKGVGVELWIVNIAGSTDKNTFLLFQGGKEGFKEDDVVIVEIIATVGKEADKATKTFTVGISVAKDDYSACSGSGK